MYRQRLINTIDEYINDLKMPLLPCAESFKLYCYQVFGAKIIRDHLVDHKVADSDIYALIQYYADKLDNWACEDARMSHYYSTAHDAAMDILDIFICMN